MLIVPKPVVFPNDEQVEDDKTVEIVECGRWINKDSLRLAKNFGQLEANRNQGQHWTIVYCHTLPILKFQLS